MNEHDVLCNRCLGLINRRLSDDDLLILVVLRGGDKNMDSIIYKSRLGTSKTRASISRLYGACLIDIRKLGNHRMIKLTPSGKLLCKSLESDFKNKKGGN